MCRRRQIKSLKPTLKGFVQFLCKAITVLVCSINIIHLCCDVGSLDGMFFTATSLPYSGLIVLNICLIPGVIFRWKMLKNDVKIQRDHMMTSIMQTTYNKQQKQHAKVFCQLFLVVVVCQQSKVLGIITCFMIIIVQIFIVVFIYGHFLIKRRREKKQNNFLVFILFYFVCQNSINMRRFDLRLFCFLFVIDRERTSSGICNLYYVIVSKL